MRPSRHCNRTWHSTPYHLLQYSHTGRLVDHVRISRRTRHHSTSTRRQRSSPRQSKTTWTRTFATTSVRRHRRRITRRRSRRTRRHDSRRSNRLKNSPSNPYLMSSRRTRRRARHPWSNLPSRRPDVHKHRHRIDRSRQSNARRRTLRHHMTRRSHQIILLTTRNNRRRRHRAARDPRRNRQRNRYSIQHGRRMKSSNNTHRRDRHRTHLNRSVISNRQTNNLYFPVKHRMKVN